MDRKSFLTAFAEYKKTTRQFPSPPPSSASPLTVSLLPYTGVWTRKEAAHLLRRATFGVKKSDVTAFLALTPSQAVDQLLQSEPMPPNPVNDFEGSFSGTDAVDGVVPPGADWTISPGVPQGNVWFRHLSFEVWVLKQALNQPRSAREKMTLFWGNHFGTSQTIDGVLRDTRRVFHHHNTLRANALGNVKTLVNLITRDAHMLQFLSGDSNTKDDPNENYAREIQELFVVGKYPVQQYSEEDVRQAAKLLTGWKFNEPYATYFEPNDHDTGNKTFSAFYNNTVINGQSGSGAGQAELDAFLNMIFAPVDSARFICRKLYRFFVQYKITPEVESLIIQPLADTFRANNFEIKPVLSQLLKSQHFFDLAYNTAGIIKSPLDLYAGLMKTFRTQDSSPTGIIPQYEGLVDYSDLLGKVEMPIAQPPNVAGYAAYTSPLYDKYWISTVTLPRRQDRLNILLNATVYPFFDIIKFTDSFDNPGNPNLLIAEAIDLLYAIPVGSELIAYLKTILLSGQTTDGYWTSAWNAYKANPNDAVAYGVVLTRLTNLYNYLINLEEIHLM